MSILSSNMIRIVCFLLIIAVARAVEIYKCCPSGKGVNSEHICSENAVIDWQPVFFSEDEQKLLLPPNTTPQSITFIENTFPSCNSTNHLYISNSHYPLIFDKSGLMLVNGYANQDMALQPTMYCTSATGAIICADEDVLNKKKKLEKNIHKCCVVDSIYSEKKTSCVPQNVSKSNFLSEDTAIFSGFPTCPSQEHLLKSGKLDIDYSLNADGTLRANSSQIVKNYCVDYVLEKPNEKASVFTCSPLSNINDGDQQGIQFKLYSSGFFVSVFFLTLTLISTFMLPGSYHALHWKCQTHYIVCLMIGDFLLGMTQALGDVLKQTRFCPLNATLVHFFFLAAFFWLNTMCFNIWWTFRDLRPSVDKGQETYRLALYRLYAWGIPLIIVGTGTVMDQMLTEQYPAILRPRFGEIKCWFHGDAELFVYFLGPVGFLLVINLLLFVATTRELTCGLWKREGVKSSTERTALSHICLKLVIVMGITWIVDVISFAVGGPIYVWFLTDLVNALQGVFIFIVVGCQPQVWNAVKRKWFVNDSSSRNGVSSNATPSVINDQPSTKQTAVETLC